MDLPLRVNRDIAMGSFDARERICEKGGMQNKRVGEKASLPQDETQLNTGK